MGLVMIMMKVMMTIMIMMMMTIMIMMMLMMTIMIMMMVRIMIFSTRSNVTDQHQPQLDHRHVTLRAGMRRW